MALLSVKPFVAAADYEQLRNFLQAAIPGGPHGTPCFGAVSDDLVDAFVVTMWHAYTPDRESEYAAIGVPPPPPELTADATIAHGQNTANRRYYLANARHTRPGVCDFVGTVPMTRYSLPDSEDDYTVETAIGKIAV